MAYSRLYIWVEGPDDERFFQQIICPLFSNKYDYIHVQQYSEEKKEYTKNFLTSIIAMKANYIFIRDIDFATCINSKKDEIKKQLGNIDLDKILVVIKEIESWYLAGLSESSCKKIGIKLRANTDINNVTKEDFNRLIPTKFQKSRIDFMQELLKLFEIEVAKENNASFKYFCDKYLT